LKENKNNYTRRIKQKYLTVGTVPKYLTVGTVPKSNKKNKNTSLSEQFQNPIPKWINQTHKYITVHFPGLEQELEKSDGVKLVLCPLSGADPGFQVRGVAHLNKLRRAEGGAKIVGVFRVKNHDFAPKNLIFSNCGGRRENFEGISCEKSRFYRQKSFFSILGGGGGAWIRPCL
jgi:hypothetical protein